MKTRRKLTNRDELQRYCYLKREEADESRKFTLSFSSEEPYERWFGIEILDHNDGAMDMTRLSEIGCVLYNHDRNAVVGRVNRVWMENRRGMAEIEFDEDEESEKIYQKVLRGTLRGVSVGYIIDDAENVRDGKTSTDGRFTGPCTVARKWTPLEISIVSVPADPTVGVGRELDLQGGAPVDVYIHQICVNKNI